MKMKKYLSIAILLMMMASPVVFTSCGNDDPMEEVENPETKLDVWTEPYHIMGANVDEVKSYMAQSMKRYRQVAETSGDNIQLTFMTGQVVKAFFTVSPVLTVLFILSLIRSEV